MSDFTEDLDFCSFPRVLGSRMTDKNEPPGEGQSSKASHLAMPRDCFLGTRYDFEEFLTSQEKSPGTSFSCSLHRVLGPLPPTGFSRGTGISMDFAVFVKLLYSSKRQ